MATRSAVDMTDNRAKQADFDIEVASNGNETPISTRSRSQTRSRSRSPWRIPIRKRRERSPEGSSSAATTHYSTADEGDQSDRQLESPNLGQVVNSLGKGLRIALHSEVPGHIRKRKRHQIHALTSQRAIAKALRKQLKLNDSSDESDDDLFFADHAIEIDENIAQNKGVSQDRYEAIKINLRREIGAKFSEADLANCLNIICEVINDNKLSEKQGTRLIASFLDDGLRTLFLAHTQRKNKIPLSTVVSRLRRYKGNRISRAEAGEKLKSWQLDYGKPQSSIFDLQAYILLAKPNSSINTVHELVKQVIKDRVPDNMCRELDQRERLYMKKHDRREMPMSRFIDEVAQLAPVPKGTRKQVNKVKATSPPTQRKKVSEQAKRTQDRVDHAPTQVVCQLESSGKIDSLIRSVNSLMNKSNKEEKPSKSPENQKSTQYFYFSSPDLKTNQVQAEPAQKLTSNEGFAVKPQNGYQTLNGQQRSFRRGWQRPNRNFQGGESNTDSFNRKFMPRDQSGNRNFNGNQRQWQNGNNGNQRRWPNGNRRQWNNNANQRPWGNASQNQQNFNNPKNGDEAPRGPPKNRRGWHFVKETDPEFCELMAENKPELENGANMNPNKKAFYWCGDKFIPFNDIEAFPVELDVLIRGNNGKARLTRKIKEFFNSKCSSCGIYGHHESSNTKLCPYGDVADTFTLCTICRSGFHSKCRIHESKNPLLKKNFSQ